MNVSPGDYAPGGLSFTGHCERRIYMDLIERGWKEDGKRKTQIRKKKKKTEPKSLKREIVRKDGDAVQALSNLVG